MSRNYITALGCWPYIYSIYRFGEGGFKIPKLKLLVFFEKIKDYGYNKGEEANF